MFHRLAGRYTIEELYEAGKSIKEQGVPNIYIFQKKLTEEDIEDGRLKKLKSILDLRYKYFIPPVYHHASELCLRVNMSVQRLLESVRQKYEHGSIPHFEVKGSRIMLGEACIGDLNNLSFSANNNEIIQLKKDLEGHSIALSDIDEKIILVQEKIDKKSRIIAKFENAEHPGKPIEGREEEWEEYKEEISTLTKDLTSIQHEKTHIKNQINRISEELEKQNSLLLDLAYQINKLSVESTNKRLQEASILLEQGNSKDVIQLLNVGSVEKDIRHNTDNYQQAEHVVENARKLLRNNVNELLICSKSCLVDRSNPYRFKEACQIRERAIGVAEKCFTEQEHAYLLFKYARFLDKNNRLEKALEFYNQANNIYFSLPENRYLKSPVTEFILSIPPSDSMPVMARCLNLVGNLYNSIGECQLAENNYQKAFLYYQVLLRYYPQSNYDHNIILVKNNLGVLYYKNDKKEEGEELLTNSLLEYENMSEEKQLEYLADIAMVWLNIGCFYQNDTRRHRKARVYIHRALDAYRKLNSDKPDKYKSDMASCFYHLGNLSVDNDWKEGETFLLNSLEIRKELAKEKPEIYLPSVACTYFSLGKLYWYKAAKILEKEHGLSIDKLEENLKFDLEWDKELILHAIDMYHCSLQNYTDMEVEEQLESGKTNTRYSGKIVEIYYTLGKLYCRNKQWQLAFEAYNCSLERCKGLMEYSNIYRDMISYIENSLSQIEAFLNYKH